MTHPFKDTVRGTENELSDKEIARVGLDNKVNGAHVLARVKMITCVEGGLNPEGRSVLIEKKLLLLLQNIRPFAGCWPERQSWAGSTSLTLASPVWYT
jgi:hypothetical protein